MIPLPAMQGKTAAVLGPRPVRPVRLPRARGERRAGLGLGRRRRRAAARRPPTGVPLVDLAICNWARIDRLVLSPGIPARHPRPAPGGAARARGRRARSSATSSCWSRATREQRLVGITGTNGKSTTTALVGTLLRHAGLGGAGRRQYRLAPTRSIA